MSNFQQAIAKAKRLKPQKISNDLFKFITTLEKELSDNNVSTIYNDSEDIDGNPLGFYSLATENITGGRKTAGQPFDLKETGEFLNSFYAKVESESIFFDATDEKKQEVLMNLLSHNIFGLNDKDLKRVIDEKLLPFFLTYFRKELL